MFNIEKHISSASWVRFAIWFAILFAFSNWAFNMDSPWTRALEAAQGALPEVQAGLPAIEPQRSLDLLGDATSDYLLWQVLDVPYAIMNLMLVATAMGLGLKATKLRTSPLRFLLLLPMIYFFAEIVENSLVAAFASGLVPTAEPIVLVQQFATTIKFASGMPGMAIGALSIVIAAIAAITSRFRKST